MADDPGHKAMLYFLETLMNSSVPLTISQLAGRFGSRNFTPEMRQSAGGNESGLKKFLLKYPSLFTVNGNLVSLNDGSASLGKDFRESSPASSCGLPDVSVETEAVQYFRKKIIKKGEKWLPIKSLAGHLSQSSSEIRECVGPQTDFHEWLLRHPLIFDVKGEMVSLKDNITVNAVNPDCDPFDDPPMALAPPPAVRFSGVIEKEPYPAQYTPKTKRRPKSLSDFAPEPVQPQSAPLTPTTPRSAGFRGGPITMTANEYKAVMFIKSIIEKKGDMRLNSLTGHFSQAPESLRNTIGWSKPELEKFLRSHANIFLIDEDETVSVIKNARLNVIITGSRPPPQPRPTLTGRKGRIYHVAKLWGIIDLGRHEHVFIDRSIFGKHIDELNKLLSVGEMVTFDAIPAPKGSRARWRATRISKENESIEDLVDRVAAKLSLPIDGHYREPPSPMGNIDDEIRGMIPEMDDSCVPMSPTVKVGGLRYQFHDAAPSGTGVVPVWNFRHVELDGMKDVDDLDLSDDLDSDSPSLSMVAERYYMNRSVLGDSPREEKEKRKLNGMTNGTASAEESFGSSSTVNSRKKMCNASCQTIVTGDVLATQLFHEEF